MPGATHNNDDTVEVPDIMRALEPEVVDAVWAAVEPLLPPPDRSHPLGCHRPRVPDRVCFRGILIRLVTGSSWVDIEAILDHQVSDTTLRARRNEWIDAGVFDSLKNEAIAAFDRIIGLDLEHVALDGSLHKAPCGGEGTGPTPPIGPSWAGNGPSPPSVTGSRSGGRSTAPTATTSACSNPPSTPSPPPACSPTSAPCTSTGATTTALCATSCGPRRIDEFEIQLRGTKVPGVKKQPLRLGLRWIVEATNTWWSNYGQLRRNTDRRNRHRHAALCLATTVLIVGRLIDWRDRWNPAT
jgi:Transposase and inactivated derivatives